MSSLHDIEKEEPTHLGRGSSIESENEIFNLRKVEEGATGFPDSRHKEVEEMDAGHMRDLELQHVCMLNPTCPDSN